MSLTLLEDVRKSVIQTFKDVQGLYYPAMSVNYPNLTVVDIEHQADPFVSVSLDLSKVERAALGDKELLVPGVLEVYYYFREGTGTSSALNYTDTLNAYLCMQQIGDIYYHAVKPMNVKTFPAWVGVLNYIRFDISSPVCST
jgi:hypothetical protein